MQVLVNVNDIQIIKNDILNENEYNIHNIKFIFSNEYGDDLAKVALFSSESATYKIIISNNECNIPPEILAQKGCFTLGVYAFEVENDVLVERYSPTPLKINIENGSYIPDEDTENSVPLTPTDKEQILDALSRIQIDSEQITQNAQDIAEIKEEQIEQNSAIEQLENQIPTKTSELINDSGFISQSALTNAINEEKTLRQNADNNLQSQIDAISASSDVIDVLGTYQDLQNYDTSHVKANDIIKVLQDSTHDNAQSYYRWVITQNVGSWQYVGSEAPTYTKSEIDEKFQDVDSDIDGISDYLDTIEGNISDIEAEQITQNSRITELEEQVNDLENNQLTGTASGTSIDLEDSADARVRSIELKGNSTQETTIGKNLMPVTNQDFTINEIRFRAESGKIIISGIANANVTGFVMKNDNYFPVTLSAGTYYLTRNLTNITVGIIQKTSDTVVATLPSTSTSKSVSFTLNATTDLYLFFYIANGTAISDYTGEIMISTSGGDWEKFTYGASPNPSYPQPIYSAGDNETISATIENENGTQNQDFTIPCQQPMRSVGDVRDYFVKVDGIWYERHNILKMDLDGTKSWQTASTTDDYYYFYSASYDSLIATIYKCLCNKFADLEGQMIASTTVKTDTISVGGSQYAKVRIKIKKSRLTDGSVNTFKSWLSSEIPELYCEAQTPTNLLCTEEQTEVLEDYIKARTYKNVTHIYSEDETPAYQEIVYVKDTEAGINELIDAQIGDAIGGAY